MSDIKWPAINSYAAKLILASERQGNTTERTPEYADTQSILVVGFIKTI
jgi:hypothetical protein